jgi:hypothetical protein
MALFPLGILSAAGAGGGVPLSDYELISSTILGSSTPSITFSSLGTYSSTYKHLQIRAITRSDRSDVDESLQLRFNSVTGSGNYRAHELIGNGSTVSSSPFGETDRILTGFATVGATATANAFGGIVIDILDPYSTSKNTTIKALSGATVSTRTRVILSSGVWLNTNAVSSIDLAPFFGSNFVAGSRFSIYGIRG